MGKLIAILVILGVGFGIYRATFYKSPAYKTYLQWTKATSTGDCGTLYSLADGDAKKWVDGFCGASGAMTVYGKVIPGPSVAGMVAELANTPNGVMRQVRHELQSEDEADDGTVSLKVVETVLGRNTNFNKVPPPRLLELKLRETGDSWKILDYKDQEAKP